MTRTRRPHMIPFLIVALSVLGVLKFSGFVIGFSAAEAQGEPVIQTASEEAAQQEVAPPEIAPGEVERRILERLAERRKAIEAREKDLDLREAVIAAAEAKLARGFEDFENERAEIIELREAREAASTEEVEALVSAYERMKARDAAVIFNELEEEIMLAVASKMRTQALAGVLAEMQPGKARQLTVLLAERGQIISAPASAAAGQ